MTTRFLRFRPGQLSGRFAALVILFSSLIALVLTATELGYEYVRDLRQIDGRMAQIRDAYVDSITENLWVADKERLDTQLQGIVRLPDFVLAEIRVNGKTEIRHGPGLAGGGVSHAFALERPHQGRMQHIGELVVGASYEGAFQRMIQRTLLFLAANAMKTMLVALFIVALFYRLVGRHVEKISVYAHEHDHPDGAPELALNRPPPVRPDELSELVGAINHLRQQLIEHVRHESLRAQTLEEAVAERTAEIRAQQAALRLARDEAEWASRAKSHFLASMSHELRTPLNAILGFAQILEMTADTADQKEGVTHIIEAGKQLMTMLENVLELTATEVRQLHYPLELVAVSEMLQSGTKQFRQLAERQGMKFELEEAQVGPTAFIHINRQRLLQALANYVSNAIKYGQPDGCIYLGASMGDGRVRIAVRDEGPGIPVELQAQLFTPFNRLGRENSDVLGAGLGLSVAREVVEVMGGRVGVASQPGQGATFWMDFPLAVGAEGRLPVVSACPTAEKSNL